LSSFNDNDVDLQLQATRQMSRFWNGFNFNRGSSSATALDRPARALLIGLLALVLTTPWPLQAAQTATGSTNFIPTFLVYSGGAPVLVASDAPKLAKFDLINIDRFRYDNIGPNTWTAIKAINPDVRIYLYQMGPEAPNYMDSTAQLYLTGLGRYDIARGHFMGSLNGDHPELFLLGSSGNRIYSKGVSNVSANQFWHLMDFGSAAYHSYWLTAVKADIVDQPWVADGVFVDNCLTLASEGDYSGTPSMYSNNAGWSGAMNTFVEAITGGLHGYGQKLWCNRGGTRMVDGSAAWLTLDGSGTPPDVVLEEGAFAVKSGSSSVQFYQESRWKRQVDTIGAIRNSRVAMMSHTKLAEDQTGTDNSGNPVTFWQSLWYSLGSFLLGKNDQLNNAYFMFSGGSGYDKIWWYDEYDNIDLGKAIGPYAVMTIGSVNIYWREFERGYVYVNPTPNNVTSVNLPQESRQLTRDNMTSLPDSIASISAISLNGHHAAILLKTVVAPTADTTAPSVPTGVVGTAASPSEINLTWNASTDNVGVTGYRVYRDGALVASPTSTSVSITGLAASTPYSFTVTAVDAAGNASAQSSTLSVTTQAPPDTTAPSVPTGLVGAAVSSTQINLTWNASTDNVGVVGYYVYLNDVALGATTATSFQHTGITAGTTYNYRVSAFDAVPNHSAWTATPVAVTTPPPPDTQAPSSPANLAATGVSASQVDLSWNAATDNVGVTGYRVYNGALVASPAGTSVSITGLSASTLYAFTVAALDAAGNASAQSAPLSVSTPAPPDTTAPSTPTGLTASAVTPTSLTLSWSAATDNVGVSGYFVFRNGVRIANVSTTSYSDAGLVAATTYSYTIAAYDAAGNASAQSGAVSATTPALPDTQAPSVPTGLTGTAVSSSQVNLSWNPATDNVGVTGYSVYLNDTLLTRITTTSFQHTGLSAGATYNYRVSAHDVVPNHSAWSATPVAVTTPAAPDTQAPSVPTGLVGTAVSSSQVNLSWNPATDNVGVTGYSVYLNDTLLTRTTTTSFQHTGLSAGAIYNYRVSAHDAVPNHSAWTAAVAVTTLPAPDAQAPGIPANLAAASVTASQINLSWSAATDNVGVSGYYVFRNGVQIANVSANSYSDTGLVAATTYSYTIAAYDAAGNASAQSGAVSATTPALLDTQAPSVPTGLTGTAVSSSQVNLSWNPSTDNVRVTGYVVYLNNVSLATTTTTSFSHTGLTPGTTYNYRVSAFDAAPNHSAWTATPVAVTTPAAADTQAPSVPAGLVGTAVSSSQINLSWNPATDNVGVTGYVVYLNNVSLATTTTTSFSHTGLTPGTTYNYRVSAFDAVPNHSAWTATPVAVTTPAPPDTTTPSVPAGLVGAAVSPSQVNLSWNPSTDNVGVTGYRVYRDGALVTSSTGTSVSITALSASTLYAFTVAAVDAAGNASAQSAPLSVTTPAAPDTTAPTTPAGLTASAVTPTSLTLSWNAATDNVGVTGYRVYNGTLVASPTSTSVLITGLSAGTLYAFTVAALDAAGNASAQSAPVSVTTPAPPDTTAPSVPAGLVGTAVSSSQINLSWNPAIDNVGVTGYVVYLNNVSLATMTTTSFSHTGLIAGTTYNYRVSAFDAVPNHSAWTATPVAVTTPAPAAVTPQATTFSSTLEEFSNPERGLSRMWSNLTDLSSSWLVAHRNAGYRLVTHRQSLSSYVNTATLPQSFLDSLDAGAALHRANGTKMAMQFSYWFTSGSPEPTLTTILGHIAQLKPFFTANTDVIAAVHGGFLGQYGEWAFSSEASVGSPTPSAAAKIAVRDALLAAVPADIPIGWRYVADLMKWYPTPVNESQAFTGANQARSGIHNDCFLSNKDDSGTYWESGVSPTGRTPEDNKFRAYHAAVSNWTTMGGENCNSGQYTACADVLNDGPLYRWRYLRDDWGTVFHDGWKAQGCYPEIKRSLGYRFQLDAISHPQSAARGSAVDVEIDLRNVGWARIFTARRLVVTLRHIASGALITGNAGDMKLLPPRAASSTRIVVAVPIPAAASPGDYDVYVSMPDIWPATKDKADFAVRFANADDAAKGQAWEAANFRFKTGTMLTVQ
jgi:chitodextrinase